MKLNLSTTFFKNYNFFESDGRKTKLPFRTPKRRRTERQCEEVAYAACRRAIRAV